VTHERLSDVDYNKTGMKTAVCIDLSPIYHKSKGINAAELGY